MACELSGIAAYCELTCGFAPDALKQHPPLAPHSSANDAHHLCIHTQFCIRSDMVAEARGAFAPASILARQLHSNRSSARSLHPCDTYVDQRMVSYRPF